MLGDIASIATLILFVIYFIGRTIIIFNVKPINHELLEIESPVYSDKQRQVVETCCLDDDYCNKLFLTSTNGIRNIKIYQIKYNDDFSKIIEKCEVFNHTFLNIGHTLEIQTILPECIPTYLLEFTTSDYKKISLEITDNLKNGVISELIIPKHTFKSLLLYYFQ